MAFTQARKGINTILAAGALALPAGCGPNTPEDEDKKFQTIVQRYEAAGESTDPAKINLHKALDGFHFIDQNENLVNLNALKTSLNGQCVTVSFGVGKCEDICPTTNTNLGVIGNANKKMTSIIIASQPQTDGKDQASRDSFMKEVRSYGGEQKILILFPISNPKDKKSLSEDKAIELAQKMGAITNEARKITHTASVFLYDTKGAHLDRSNGMNPSIKKWANIVNGSEFVNPKR